MIEQSIISMILDTGDVSVLKKHGLTREMFLTCGKEIDFIITHFDYYKQTPDKLTFLAEFRDFQMLDVKESMEYLAEKLREAYIYTKFAPILQNTADKVREDSLDAIEYIKAELEKLTKLANVRGNTDGYDIVANARERLEEYKRRCEVKGMIGIPTGIPQLDELTNGWLWGEELVVIAGRTNVGKSWIGEYFGVMAWKMGYKVLMYSGEMSKEMVGFRFDTLNSHFSNMGLLNGATSLGTRDEDGYSQRAEDYEAYINGLGSEGGFIVLTPQDFGGRKPTADDLKEQALKHGADMVIVDQLSLMSDKRRADTPRIAFNNITEDLFLLSQEIRKPIILLAQANREAVKNKKKGESPELHDLAESDGIGQNATRVISLSVIDGTLKLSLKKNRYGINNREVLMIWDINMGYLKPLISDSPTAEKTSEDYGF